MPAAPAAIRHPPSAIPKRVPLAAHQQWHITDPAFKGPREDVLAALDGLQSVPTEWINAITQTIHALPKEIRGISITARHAAHGDSGSLNLHWQKLF